MNVKKCRKFPVQTKIFQRQSPFTISLQDSINIQIRSNEHAKQWFCVYRAKFSSVAYFDMTTITWLLFHFVDVFSFAVQLVGRCSYLKSWTWRTGENVDSLVRTVCVRAFFLTSVFFILDRWNAVFGCDLADCYYSRALHKCLAKKKKMFNALCERSKINQLQNAGMYSTHFFLCALQCTSPTWHSIECMHACLLACEYSHSLTHSLISRT